LRAVLWANALSYRTTAPGYFSPARQLRVDAGLHYTQAVGRPRFRNDRRRAVTGGLLIGTDERGILYLHPSLDASWELMPGLEAAVGGNWIRSSVYDETAVSISIRLLGSASSR
jgi:hypothetical protein